MEQEEFIINDLSDNAWNTHNLIIRLVGIKNDANKQLLKENQSEQILYDINEYIDLIITRIENRIYQEKITDIRWFDRLKIAVKDLVIIQNKIKTILPIEIINENFEVKEFYKEVNDKLLNLDTPISKPNTEQYNSFKLFVNNDNDDSKTKIKSDKIFKNPYPYIFKDTLSFQIFLNLHNLFKNKPYPLANYSFIFRAMKQDEDRIVGSNIDYIKLITEEYNVSDIDRIKSWGNLPFKKMDLYNAIKKNTISKHD